MKHQFNWVDVVLAWVAIGTVAGTLVAMLSLYGRGAWRRVQAALSDPDEAPSLLEYSGMDDLFEEDPDLDTGRHHIGRVQPVPPEHGLSEHTAALYLHYGWHRPLADWRESRRGDWDWLADFPSGAWPTVQFDSSLVGTVAAQ